MQYYYPLQKHAHVALLFSVFFHSFSGAHQKLWVYRQKPLDLSCAIRRRLKLPYKIIHRGLSFRLHSFLINSETFARASPCNRPCHPYTQPPYLSILEQFSKESSNLLAFSLFFLLFFSEIFVGALVPLVIIEKQLPGSECRIE